MSRINIFFGEPPYPILVSNDKAGDERSATLPIKTSARFRNIDVFYSGVEVVRDRHWVEI